MRRAVVHRAGGRAQQARETACPGVRAKSQQAAAAGTLGPWKSFGILWDEQRELQKGFAGGVADLSVCVLELEGRELWLLAPQRIGLTGWGSELRRGRAGLLTLSVLTSSLETGICCQVSSGWHLVSKTDLMSSGMSWKKGNQMAGIEGSRDVGATMTKDKKEQGVDLQSFCLAVGKEERWKENMGFGFGKQPQS